MVRLGKLAAMHGEQVIAAAGQRPVMHNREIQLAAKTRMGRPRRAASEQQSTEHKDPATTRDFPFVQTRTSTIP